MAQDDERYRVANDLHEQGYPPLSRDDAARYARALVRRFGSKADAVPHRDVPMWKTHILFEFGARDGARRCWVSRKPTRGAHKGWGRLIHDMGHMVHRYRNPALRSHANGEHAIETEIAYYVRSQTDWLKAKAEVPKLSPLLKAARANQRDTDALERWEAKLKRATRAIRKIKRRLRARLRRVEGLKS